MKIESDRLKKLLTVLLQKKMDKCSNVIQKLDVIYWIDDMLGIIEETEREELLDGPIDEGDPTAALEFLETLRENKLEQN